MVTQITQPKSSSTPAQIPVSKPVERWAAIEGKWDFPSGRAIYQGPAGKDKVERPWGIAIGSIPFRDGSVSTRIKLTRNHKTAAGILFGYHSANAHYWIAQLGAYDSAYAITEYDPGVGWKALVQAGHVSNFKIDSEFRLDVKVLGQNVSMTVDEVPVLSVYLSRPSEGTGLGLFAWDDAPIEFMQTSLLPETPRIFVIMPFSEPFDTLYRDVIFPVARNLDFEVVRVDELAGPGIILEDIQRQIAESHAVVAEISSRNPNVFYELGFAHARNKPAVLLVRREDGQGMPFDIRGYRAIFYDDTIGGKRMVERDLAKHLQAILHNG
jgi:hypothetical protein